MADPNPDSISDKNVKAPNVFERAKSEFEAITHHDSHTPKHHKETHGRSDDIDETTPVDDVKGPSVFERMKEEVEALVEAVHPAKDHDSKSPKHDKETHGRSDDIDETTPIDDVKGPSVFGRMKEEVEALVEAVHPKKKDHDSSS